MQEYRINYRLLIVLLVGAVLTAGAAYGLWRYQMLRSSDYLLAEAGKAIEAKKYRDAIGHYAHYLAIQPKDDASRIQYANAYSELISQGDAKPEDFGKAMGVLESTVRQLPDAKELRLQLAKLYATFGRTDDALSHVRILLEKEPENREAKLLEVQYEIHAGAFDGAIKKSYALIGYDPEENTFDEKRATAANEPQVYASLAGVLRTRKRDPELADQVMDQMIKANPDSATAYLYRGSYLTSNGEKEKGAADIEKAYGLDKENADIVLTIGSQAAENQQYDKAREYLEAGKKLHPKDERFYHSLALVEMRDNNYEGALAQLEEGLKAAAGAKLPMLLLFKANVQADHNDLDGVRKTIEDMATAKLNSDLIDWWKARVKVGEGKWFEAAKDLDRLRPKFANSTLYDFLFQTDLFLGLCYEKLGRFEQARDAYVSAIQLRPDHAPAQFGRQRMETRLGQVTPDAGGSKGRVIDFQGLVNKELQKPKEQRDWGPAEEAIRSIADQGKVDETTIKLMQANLALFQEDFPAARKILQEADELSPHTLQIRRTAVQVLQADPKQGPAAALKLLDRVVKEFDDLPTLRLQRAQLLVALAGEDRNDQLAELEQPGDKWTDEQKSELLTGMAGIYLGLNMNDEARRCLTLVADLKPQDLPTRLAVFQLAMQSGDDEAMQAAQKKILEIVGDESDSTWLYAEARRKLSQVRRGLLGNESLAEIRNLVDRAILDRPNWNELYLLNAELELLAGNAELALQHYEKAAELGRGDATSVAQHIRLVSSQGNFRRAKELLDRVPEGLRQPLLGALYTEILFQTNEIDNAIEKARAVVQSDDRNLQNHLWLGQLLARSADVPGKSDAERKAAREQAIKAMERIVELQPDSPDAWYYLTRFHLANNDRTQALKMQRDAQLVVSDADLIVLLAKSHEMLGNWFDAEAMYRTHYDAAPDDIARAQQFAAFYLGNGYPRPDREAKATLLINKILQAGADNKIKPDDANLLWARRMGARILAGTRDYQKLRKAENLLASNSQGGVLSLEDKREMAELLASRPELVSRLKATRLLEEVAEVQPLDLGGGIALGQLYDQVGDWNGAKRQLRATIGRFSDSPQAREAFIRMLLQHGERADLDEAGRQLERLRQIAPNSTATFELGVRLATKTGRQSEARQELLGLLPNLTQGETLEPARVQALNLLANLLVDLEDLDDAEKVYRLLAEKDPNQAYSLARFLGLHRDVGQCFDQLKQIYSKENVGNILAVAIAVVRERREEIGDKFDAQVEEWFNSALLENPESIPLLMAQADFRDAQQRYEDSAEIYRKLVIRPDLTDIRRAIVLNNLSFLLALTDSAGAGDLDAMKLVEEAVNILGPTTDILDTRAVVLMAKGDYKKSIDDLEFSVKNTPTAAKYFHKAQAHLGAGDDKAALEAWQRAEELGLTRDGLNRLEHHRYDELKQRIDAVRTSSEAVTHAEPAR